MVWRMLPKLNIHAKNCGFQRTQNKTTEIFTWEWKGDLNEHRLF